MGNGNRYVISACLAGVPCRFDGCSKPNAAILALMELCPCILVCPEVLGGLPTPRVPCERQEDRVVSESGLDCTGEYVRGAKNSLKQALTFGATHAILKAKSPSCGVGTIYDGSFRRVLAEGDGVFAAMLRKCGIPVMSELS